MGGEGVHAWAGEGGEGGEGGGEGEEGEEGGGGEQGGTLSLPLPLSPAQRWTWSILSDPEAPSHPAAFSALLRVSCGARVGAGCFSLFSSRVYV